MKMYIYIYIYKHTTCCITTIEKDIISQNFLIPTQVWFRKGVEASCYHGSSESEAEKQQKAEGTGWLPMVQRLRVLAVGPNDQVL